MQTIADLPGLRARVREWQRAGDRIALVPTMGNLHDGHLSLLARARQIAQRTIVSIFVNPIQFGRGEDYERYPSTLAQDGAKLAAAGLDLLFAPNLSELYPGGIDQDTRVSVPELSNILCGEFRPGHFSGVATVVSKLFINAQPDIALFGEKDYQQLLVIRRMARDLCFPIEIVGMPIVREPDGLAMSSRNGYLTVDERRTAASIYRILRAAAAVLHSAGKSFADIEAAAHAELVAAGFRPEYVSIRRHGDLGVPEPGERHCAILVAAWLGNTRLIDNVHVDLDGPA